MDYAQEYIIEEDCAAASVKLLINGKWVEAELRDTENNIIQLPHSVKKGERYILVVKG